MKIHKRSYISKLTGLPEEYEFATFQLGEKVFYPFDWYRVVEATITGLSDVYQVPGFEYSIWAYTNETGFHVAMPSGNKNEGGWDIPNWTNQLPDGAELVNQFIDIDEPVGHSIQYYPDYPGESEFFLTLEEALAHVKPSKRNKKPRIKLKQYRNRRAGFIGGTHTNNGYRWENPFKNLPDKKIYVRHG